jgi:FAD dependent oxidoreductase
MVAKYDLVVIGAGSAGEKGAAQAAYFGKRVAVVDPNPRPGGIAVSTAGIPTKTLREGAIYLSGLGQSAGGLVAAAGARDPWRLLMTRKLEVSEFMTRAVERNLVRHGIEQICGHARFLPDRSVEVEKVGGERVVLEADIVLIALRVETPPSAWHRDGRPRRARLREHPRDRTSAGFDPRHRRWLRGVRICVDLRWARGTGDRRGRRRSPAPGARRRDGAGPRRVLQLHGDPRHSRGLGVRRRSRGRCARGQACRRPHAPGREDLGHRAAPANRGPGPRGGRRGDRLRRLGWTTATRPPPRGSSPPAT